MNSRTLPLALLLIAALTSCSSTNFYQVCQTQSETVKAVNGRTLSYENNQCRIDYDLWSENGNAGFTFYNKTAAMIYLHMDESFYVTNGIAYDYFQNRTFTSGSNAVVAKSAGMGVGRYGIISTFSSAVIDSKMSGVEITEAKTIAIPPKTAKRISEYSISRELYRDCALLRFPSVRKMATQSFTAENSPLKFYNTISYTLGADEERQKVINDFSVISVTNYPEKELLKTIRREFCGEKELTNKKVMTGAAPDKFYLKYQKKEGDNLKH